MQGHQCQRRKFWRTWDRWNRLEAQDCFSQLVVTKHHKLLSSMAIRLCSKTWSQQFIFFSVATSQAHNCLSCVNRGKIACISAIRGQIACTSVSRGQMACTSVSRGQMACTSVSGRQLARTSDQASVTQFLTMPLMNTSPAILCRWCCRAPLRAVNCRLS